jgi:hypothetical protein
MDISSSIVNLATDMSNDSLQQAVGIAVLKKAIDSQAENSLQLLQALPALPTVSSTGGVAGQVVNVKA